MVVVALSSPERVTVTPSRGPTSATATLPRIELVRTNEPLKSSVTACPAVAMTAEPDVDENVASAGKPLMVTTYVPAGTFAKEYAPFASVAVVAPLLSDTVTPERPCPSADTVPLMVPSTWTLVPPSSQAAKANAARVAREKSLSFLIIQFSPMKVTFFARSAPPFPAGV